jgi:hypothetical protein
VEGAGEGDQLVPAGGVTGQLQAGLDRLGAGVGEEHLLTAADGREGYEPLGQPDLDVVVEVGAGHVDEVGRLALDGLDDLRVAVAGGRHGDAGRQVEEGDPVRVPHAAAAAAGHDEGVATGVGRAHHPLVPRHDGRRLRARQLRRRRGGIAGGGLRGHAALLLQRYGSSPGAGPAEDSRRPVAGQRDGLGGSDARPAAAHLLAVGRGE